MSDEKVIVTKLKLDSLATSISNKSGVAVPLTIAQMKTAVDGISTGSGGSITIEEIPNATGTTLQITTNGSGGGSTPSATQHDIYFEFSDETDTTITAYYNDSFISDAITATIPTTYGNKTVTLAQLDSVTWYEPTSIPLNTQLIDYASVRTGYTIDNNGNIISSDAWNCVTDYTAIESTMTFSFMCNQYASIGFYDSEKNAIRTVQADSIKDSAENYVASGSLTPSIIPVNARYVAMVGNAYGVSDTLSLIRTA